MVRRHNQGLKLANGATRQHNRTFSGGTPTPTPSYPTPPDGYDIILMVGDSTEHGQNAGSGTCYVPDRVTRDVDMAGVYQFTGPDATANGATANVISSDITPLYCNNNNNTQDHVAPGEQLGRAYKAGAAAQVANPNRRVLLVNMSHAGQAIMSSATVAGGTLARGGTTYEPAVTQFNNAVTAAKNAFPGSRVVGFSFTSGANDGNFAGINTTTFATEYEAIVDDLRARVTGASQAWFIVSGILPRPQLATTDYDNIRTAQAAIVAAKSNAFLVLPGTTGSGAGGFDGLHPPAAANWQWGADKFTAIASAAEPTTVEQFTIPPKSNQVANALIYSDPVVPNIGYGVQYTWTTTGPGVKKNGGSPATSGTGYWGDSFEIGNQLGASGTTSPSFSVTSTAGTITATFDGTVASATTHFMRSLVDNSIFFDNGKMRTASGLAMETQ